MAKLIMGNVSNSWKMNIGAIFLLSKLLEFLVQHPIGFENRFLELTDWWAHVCVIIYIDLACDLLKMSLLLCRLGPSICYSILYLKNNILFTNWTLNWSCVDMTERIEYLHKLKILIRSSDNFSKIVASWKM